MAQACSDLRHETESEVVWCTLFLRRFGSDFWGEATIGPHPYTVRLWFPHLSINRKLVHSRLTCHRAGGQCVPEQANAWLENPISDLFARFSLSSERESEGKNGESDDEDENEDGIGHAAALREFVRLHATRDGYGGWKQAYRRYACACLVARLTVCAGLCAVVGVAVCVALSMHEMVTEWRKPVDSAFILAGLPAFSTLSAIANIIKEEALKGFSSFALARASVPSDADIHLEADIVSPAGTLPPKCIRPHQQQTPSSSCANTWRRTSLGFAVSCVSCVVRACVLDRQV